jgi:hypothetical protein
MRGLLDEARAQWGELAGGFVGRVIRPWARPTAALYLLLAVALFGGAGLWVTVLRAWFFNATPAELAFGIATYAFAIIMTSIGDLILDREVNGALRYLLFAIAICALLLGVGLPYFRAFVTNIASFSNGLLIACIVPTWVTWWLVNGVDERFLMPTSPKAALGGDAGQALS